MVRIDGLDRLPLNRVLKDLQDHVVHWDSQFGEFEKIISHSDKDIRRLTAHTTSQIGGQRRDYRSWTFWSENHQDLPQISQITDGKVTPNEHTEVTEKGRDIETSHSEVPESHDAQRRTIRGNRCSINP